MEKLKIVFMGTPDFAAEALKRLYDWDGGEILAVYTQPDRPCGRGRACRPSPVKALAMEHGTDIRQPLNFKDPADVADLVALEPDVLVVAAYGLILPQTVLDAAKLLPINIHASLLPKYRGAAPIQRAVAEGESVTGITIMKMEAGLDTGPILLQRALRIGADDDAGLIHDELAVMGAELVVQALEKLRAGTLPLISQDDSRATYAHKLTKQDGLVDWDRPADEVHNQIRGMYPWPGAYFFWDSGDGKNLRLSLSPGRIGPDKADWEKVGNAPGEIVGQVDGMLAIACRDKLYLTPSVKPEGRKSMDAAAFCCGYLDRC